ncbi:hypothetical protein Sste5346_002057 [Sporothrix stenoceras]|uniref:Uncharacterized protein n=1 Tax=Sporothrix stenoceras TaxID=5173 RepID=A0ABR3ZJU3_9PEZI
MFAKFIFSAVLALLLSASPVLAHMTLASPVPFGDPTTSPLNSDGSNYPCQIVGSPSTFYADAASTSANNTMALGATQTLSFHGSAVHGGGSCQLALTTDMQPSASTSWQVILSIEGGCPTTDGTGPSTYDYTIPDSIAPGKYVFAWTWISKLSGAPEYYMNCAPVTITGNASKSKRETVDSGVIEVRDGNSTSSAALPNLFVANLASINSCKTTTSTDPVYPDPGPNVLKPSKMTTNFQSPSGTDCFPLGASNSSSSSGSGSGSGSSSSAAPVAASSAAVPVVASSAAVPGTTLTTLTKSSSSAAAVTTAPVVGNGTTTAAAATGTGGIFVTVSGASSAAAATTAAATTPAAASSATSAAPAASASSGSTSSSGGLSGACTTEGMFNCVGGSEYQQCASGTWTALQAMPAGTKCQDGQSTTLWARSFRRVRRL